MPSTTTTMAGAILLAGAAVANPLATFEVCQAADPKIPAVTVTAQHQTISTCSPVSTTCATVTSTLTGGWGDWSPSGSASPSASASATTYTTCTTDYSYSSWAYVSTVIPCAWDGKSISSCTVTKTEQDVLCSASATTVTSVFPIHTGFIGNTTNATTTYSTSYKTISKQWVAPYKSLGPNAIPGYDGNDFFQGASKDDGSSSQSFDVTECFVSEGAAPSCSNYPEFRTFSKPGSSTPVTATNSVKTSVASAGAYTFTFTNTAPDATITSGGQAYTYPGQPWFNYETRSVDGPSDFDFTVTITKTIYVGYPGSTSTGSSKSADPTAFGWGVWDAPAAPTGSASDAGFYIPVNSGSGSKYSKSGNQWVGFPNGGDDAAVVSDKNNAAKFSWDADGNLMFGDKYVSTSTSAGYLVFELGSNKPSGPKFVVGDDGSFNLPGAAFCATDDTFFITFSGSPSGCKPVSCNINGDGSYTSTSTTTTGATIGGGWGSWPTGTTSTSTSTYTWSTPTSTSTWTWSTSTSSSTSSSTTSDTTTTSATTTFSLPGFPFTTSTSSAPTTTFETSTTTKETSSQATTTSSSEAESIDGSKEVVADPSADLDADTPAPTARPRKRGGVLRKRAPTY